MARLFGLLGNRFELTLPILASEEQVLRVQSRGAIGWGLGFVQGGEVLMRRRPVDDRGALKPAELAADIRTDFLLGHIRRATVGTLSPENTHPFRYRQWLFAQTGTVPSFETLRGRLLESVPEFLRAGIRGDTDAEVVFHLFLSFLHDEGVVDSASAGSVARALRSTVALVQASVAEDGGDKSELNLMVGNGEFFVAAHHGARMAYRMFQGRHEAEGLANESPQLRSKIPEPAGFHAVLLASDFGSPAETSESGGPPASVEPLRSPAAPWQAVPAGAVVIVARDVPPVIEAP